MAGLAELAKHEWECVSIAFCDGTTTVRSYVCKRCGASGEAPDADGHPQAPKLRVFCSDYLIKSVMDQ